jgi:hypothetical protein
MKMIVSLAGLALAAVLAVFCCSLHCSKAGAGALSDAKWRRGTIAATYAAGGFVAALLVFAMLSPS